MAVTVTGVLAGVTLAQVSAGNTVTCAVGSTGAYCWGANGSGQLGDGTRKNRHAPVAVKLPAGVKATGVTAGCDFSFAFTTDGLYAWGLNNDGQLGTGNQKNLAAPAPVNFIFLSPGPGRITSIFAGCNHTIALFSKGAVMAWGADADGQLGDGGAAMEDLPVPVKLPGTVKINWATLRPFKGNPAMRSRSTTCPRVEVAVSTWAA